MLKNEMKLATRQESNENGKENNTHDHIFMAGVDRW